MSTDDQEQLEQLGDVAPVELDTQGHAALRARELRDGDAISEASGKGRASAWAVYDNHELRFVPAGGVHDTREQAQRELDDLRPTTGHDLVVVKV